MDGRSWYRRGLLRETAFFLYHDYKFYPLDKYLGEPHPAGIKAGLTELGDWYHENGINHMLTNNCARLWR